MKWTPGLEPMSLTNVSLTGVNEEQERLGNTVRDS